MIGGYNVSLSFFYRCVCTYNLFFFVVVRSLYMCLCFVFSSQFFFVVITIVTRNERERIGEGIKWENLFNFQIIIVV